MDFTQVQKMKKQNMTKDEVALLVDLIQSNPILTSKETNASTNKSKDDAWTSLTSIFNARSGSVPRSKEQLKLKWDNLKKAARKRAQQIRMNNLKTGGGKPDYIPPDEILEKVAGLLGSTCTGFDVVFGGDATGLVLEVGGAAEVGELADVRIEDVDKYIVISKQNVPEDAEPSFSGLQANQKIDLCEDYHPNVESSQYFFGTPIPKQLSTKKKGKKKANSVETSSMTRNLAIASYYEKKKESLDSENEKLAFEKEKLQLEIKLLKLELSKKENNT